MSSLAGSLPKVKEPELAALLRASFSPFIIWVPRSLFARVIASGSEMPISTSSKAALSLINVTETDDCLSGTLGSSPGGSIGGLLFEPVLPRLKAPTVAPPVAGPRAAAIVMFVCTSFQSIGLPNDIF